MRIAVLLVLLATWAQAAVVLEENFDAQDDWTVTQALNDTNAVCYSGSCPWGGADPPAPWDGGRNGMSYCDNVGSNNLYIDAIPGYPVEGTGTCRGGSGKCLTLFAESCTSDFVNSDGMLFVDLGQEYADLYLRFYIKYQAGTQWDQAGSSASQKLWHVQHYDPATPNPFQYFGANEGNQPVNSGGMKVTTAGDDVQIYDGIRGWCGSGAPDDSCYYPNTGTPSMTGRWVSGSADLSGNTQLDTTNDYVRRESLETWGETTGKIGDGDWHCIEVRHKMNTHNGSAWEADGVLQIWVDGALQTHRTNIPWLKSSGEFSAETPARGWRVVAIGGNTNNYWIASGDNSGGEREQWYAIDDVVISTTYVGPDYVIGGGGAGGARPSFTGAGAIQFNNAGTLTFQ